MDVAAKIEFLKGAIASQRTTLYLQTALAALLFTLGIGVVVLGFLSPGLILADSLRTGQTLGGALVTVSGFAPIFTGRRDKIVALRTLLDGYEEQQREGPHRDETKLDQYFDQYFAKVLGG